MPKSLDSRVLGHDWESDHWMELADRIGLLREMSKLSPPDFAALIKKCSPRKAVQIISLMEAFGAKKD